jgi:hypothetical protein
MIPEARLLAILIKANRLCFSRCACEGDCFNALFWGSIALKASYHNRFGWLTFQHESEWPVRHVEMSVYVRSEFLKSQTVKC